MDQETLKDRIDLAESALGYKFTNEQTLLRALTRKAYAIESKQRKVPCKDQEVLSTLGDAVLRTVLVHSLVIRGCETPEMVTRLKIELEREEHLARVGTELNIGPLLLLGKGEARQGASEQPYVLAETIEALVGAIFLDGGYQEAEKRINAWFSHDIEVITASLEKRHAESI